MGSLSKLIIRNLKRDIMEKICVILVNYNGKEYNDKCIDSIFNSTIVERIQIVVIDNDSSDGSRERLHKKWDCDERIHIIDLAENSGFAKANNIGIHWAMKNGITNYLMLNNDTEIEPDAIEKMWRCHEENACIVTPKIFYADKSNILWCAGGRFSPIIMKPVQIGENKENSERYNKDYNCDFANGCAIFFDEKILKRTGFLDESFFLYYEDTEFSMRAKQKGIPIRYCAEAVVYHKVNGSTKGNQNYRNVYYITRNWLIYAKKRLGKKIWIFWIYFLANRLIWGGIWIVTGKPRMCQAIYMGIRDYLIWKYKPELYSDKLEEGKC